MEEEAAAIREMQAKVEKEMGAVQGPLFSLSACPLLMPDLGIDQSNRSRLLLEKLLI